MPVNIHEIRDSNVASLLTRIDQSRGASTDGKLDPREAAMAARRMNRYPHWRLAAENAFGLVPQSGAELLRFTERSPRHAALNRILGQDHIAGREEMHSARPGQRTELAQTASGERLSLSRAGRILINGKLPRDVEEISSAAMQLAQAKVDLTTLSQPQQKRFFSYLSDMTQAAQESSPSLTKQRLTSASLSLCLQLRQATAPLQKLSHAITDRILQTLDQEPNIEMRLFYLLALKQSGHKFDPAQRYALKSIENKTVPKAPPVQLYTNNRKKTMRVKHTIHEEFWREELRFYSKKNGWKLVRKNNKDTRREYVSEIKDPKGKKPPLKIRTIVQKGELDFLSDMADPKTHCIIYSGHSALGGNGSQAIADAEPMRGLPKTVLLANCRGKDNYAEFANKFPGAMLITTDGPTYSDTEFIRLHGLYQTFGRNESFAYMKRITNKRVFDERADNYIFPHEARSALLLDGDEDGMLDHSVTSKDVVFDVDAHKQASDFVRAIAFVNSELYYHWEIDLEYGKRSVYGPEYADHVVPCGKLEQPQPGEVIRLTPKEVQVGTNQKETMYNIQFDVSDLHENRDLYAGIVTTNVMMALAKNKFGQLSETEKLRSVLMGAQAVYYLDVYKNTAEKTLQDFLKYVGLEKVKPKDVYAIFDQFDAHANNAQVKAFKKLLESKYNINCASYTPKNGGQSAYIA